MEQTAVNEKIEVLAKFKKGEITPLLFRYNGRVLKIESVNLKYHLNYGDVDCYTFCISSSGNSYKISFNTKDFNWYLEEISR